MLLNLRSATAYVELYLVRSCCTTVHTESVDELCVLLVSDELRVPLAKVTRFTVAQLASVPGPDELVMTETTEMLLTGSVWYLDVRRMDCFAGPP